MSKIPVYKEEESIEIIARVNYNVNLDFWDGRNMTCGSTGRHKGLTKLRSGKFVLIHGSQWAGSRSYGIVISEKRAIEEIILSGNDELLAKYGLESKVSKYLEEEQE